MHRSINSYYHIAHVQKNKLNSIRSTTFGEFASLSFPRECTQHWIRHLHVYSLRSPPPPPPPFYFYYYYYVFAYVAYFFPPWIYNTLYGATAQYHALALCLN